MRWRGVGMFGYGKEQGLSRGLEVQCGGGSGEGSGVRLYAGTAELPGQGVARAVAEAAAVAERRLDGMISGDPGIYGVWWLGHGWCGDGGRDLWWCGRWQRVRRVASWQVVWPRRQARRLMVWHVVWRLYGQCLKALSLLGGRRQNNRSQHQASSRDQASADLVQLG